MKRFQVFAAALFLMLAEESFPANSQLSIGCEHWLKEVPQAVRRGLVAETSDANTVILAYSQSNYSSTLLEIADSLDERTNLIVVVFRSIDEKMDAEVLKKLTQKPNVTTIRIQNNYGSPWARDWVPQKVIRKNGVVEYVNLRYYAVDGANLNPSQFAAMYDLPHYQSWIRGEMGNIMTDGKGRLFTTDKIIFDNVTSRPREGITKEMVIRELKRTFEVREIHFIPQHPRDGRVGHVDLVAKYLGRINDQEVMLVSDSIHPQVKPVLDRAAAQFKDLGYHVVRVEEFEELGAAGFVNSLILNRTVFMPIYSRGYADPPARLLQLEAAALKTYEGLGFKVVPIDAYEAITHKGAVHCLSCTVNLKSATEVKDFDNY